MLHTGSLEIFFMEEPR